MKLVLLGTGPTKPVLGKGKNKRLNSSALLKFKDKNILIDCSRHFLEQMKEHGGGAKIDFIILTHGHNDATLGLSGLSKYTEDKLPLFCEPATQTRVKEDIKEPQVTFFNFEPYKKIPLGIDGLSITPFRVEHSIQPGYPTVGFRIESAGSSIVYSEDVGSVPKDSLKYYNNSEIIVFDAAMWAPKFIKGHFNHTQAMDFLKQFDAKKIYLTQAGHTYPPYDKAISEIKEYWSDNKGESKAEINLAYDGLTIDTTGLTMQLMEKYPGLYLVPKHAQMIWNGEKNLIIKSKEFRFAANKRMYLIDNNSAYGIITLKPSKEISLNEFKELRDRHKITDEERNEWWPKHTKLYAYEFDFQKFKKPKKVSIPQGAQTFVKEVNFLSEKFAQELIKDVSEYDPSVLTNEVLADDWRITLAWYSSKKQGKKIPFSIETIINLAKLIYDEINKRVKAGKMKHEFEPEKMKPLAKELFNMISKDKLLRQEETSLGQLRLLVDQFDDFKIIHNFINIVGSTIKHDAGHKPNDVDLQIRLSNPGSYLKRSVEVRLLKMYEGIKPLHFIWGDPEGSHDSFVPLYHLALIRARPEVISMKELELFEPMKSFTPLKSTATKGSTLFFDINQLIKKLYPGETE